MELGAKFTLLITHGSQHSCHNPMSTLGPNTGSARCSIVLCSDKGLRLHRGLPAAVSPQPSVASQAVPSWLISLFKIKHQVVHQEGKGLVDMMSLCDTVLCFVECLRDYHLALQSK